MRAPLPLALATAVALSACSKSPEPAPAKAPAPPPNAFTMKDLAAATAVDARLARLSLLASDVHQALSPEPGTKPAAVVKARERAKGLVPALAAALGDAERAVGIVAHPIDRRLADGALVAAKAYAERLAAAAEGTMPMGPGELFTARDALGGAITSYRASRAAWRLAAPEPAGVEREFAEARAEMQRIESGIGARTRVAPRESGHELEAGARMTGQLAARRAKAAAERLPPPLHEPAVRYAEAEARALEAFTGLFEAPEAERLALSRAYQEAKADALSALADYFAAIAAR